MDVIHVSDIVDKNATYKEARAKAEWIEEFGDAQPNLTTESRVYLEQETARLQAERNGK